MHRKSFRSLVALTLVLFISAGCGALVKQRTGMREPEYQVQQAKTFRVPMRDGVKLATDVYLPKDGGPFPTILIRTPYNKGAGHNSTAMIFAKRGYAVVAQDCRGRYQSEGKWEPFLHEGADGADTVKWLNDQKWCNGKIGLFGMSYFGFTQWQSATYASGAIATLTPTVTGSRIYDALYRQGVFVLSIGGNWGLGTAGRTDEQGMRFAPGNSFKAPLIETDNRAGRDVAHFNDWIRHPRFDGYWRPASTEGRWKEINVPVLLIGGWYDIFAGRMLADWESLRHEAGPVARNESRMIIGPWNHTFAKKMKGVNFGSEADYLSFLGDYIDWFDQHLRGEGSADLPRVMVFTTGLNDWQKLSDWPPPDAKVQKWYLHAAGQGGSLDRDEPRNEAADRFTHDPQNLVPTLGGALFPPNNAGPADLSGQGRRADVLVYTSDVFDKDLEITGPLSAEIWVTADTPDADLAVFLLDVEPDGEARLLVDGIARARYRNGGDDAWLSEKEPARLTIDLWGISHMLKKGHRLRVHIAASNYPRFAPNPCTKDDPGTATRFVKAKIKVHHDAGHPSAILLSVR